MPNEGRTKHPSHGHYGRGQGIHPRAKHLLQSGLRIWCGALRGVAGGGQGRATIGGGDIEADQITSQLTVLLFGVFLNYLNPIFITQ